MKARQKVLIVDDNKAICDVIRTIVERENVDVETLHHGFDARKALRSAKEMDLVFIDLFLPGLPGWELLDDIENNPSIKDVPVMLVSNAPISDRKKDELAGRVSIFVNKGCFDLRKVQKLADRALR